MTFKPNSAIVRSYVILILAGRMNYEEVPKLFNLKEAVAEALEIQQPQEGLFLCPSSPFYGRIVVRRDGNEKGNIHL